MKYILFLILFMSCKGKVDNKPSFQQVFDTTNIPKVQIVVLHDTIFFNDRNSVVYLHDTIYKTKIKYTKPDYLYVACDTLGNIKGDDLWDDTTEWRFDTIPSITVDSSQHQ